MQKAVVSESDETPIGIAVCADDFGADRAINAAIVELASRGRLSATSVLVDAPGARLAAAELQGLDLDVGLHLNLTECLGDLSSDDVQPLKTLILRSHLARLDPAWVRRSIDRQLDRFQTLFSRAPDYVDGHLHVHQLPVVRDALLAALRARAEQPHVWLRDTRPLPGIASGQAIGDRFKSWVIGHLGMSQLARAARRQGLSLNQGFAGVYDFSRPYPPFLDMMSHWLSRCGPRALIMTHPARRVVANDPIGWSRVREYEGLVSDRFAQLLSDQHLKIIRLSQTTSSLP